MNDILRTDNQADVPWPTHDTRSQPLAAASTVGTGPNSGSNPAGANGMLKNAVQGAHDTLDRLADRAAPAVQQLGDTRDAWLEGARHSVRAKPLVSVGIAFALGLVLARVTR